MERASGAWAQATWLRFAAKARARRARRRASRRGPGRVAASAPTFRQGSRGSRPQVPSWRQAAEARRLPRPNGPAATPPQEPERRRPLPRRRAASASEALAPGRGLGRPPRRPAARRRAQAQLGRTTPKRLAPQARPPQPRPQARTEAQRPAAAAASGLRRGRGPPAAPAERLVAEPKGSGQAGGAAPSSRRRRPMGAARTAVLLAQTWAASAG